MINFAELKLKLCKFDYDENLMCSEASKSYGTGEKNRAFKDGFLFGAKCTSDKDANIISQLLDSMEEMRINLENSTCELVNVYNNLYNVDHCKEQSILNRDIILETESKLKQLIKGE